MEYFDNYDEQLEKKIVKPDVMLIPERYYEPESDKEISEEEKYLKEKRVQEMKKVLAAQSLQDFNLADKQETSFIKPPNNNSLIDNNYDLQMKYEQEKQAREHVS